MLYDEIKPSLLFITESWLNENLPTGCLDPESCFYVMRCDRKIGRGGGVCVFVHRSLHPVEIHIGDSYRELELLCFDLSYGSKKLRFFCVYRPPNYDINARLYLDSLLTCIASYSDGNHTNVIVGDLNCPHIDWAIHSCANNYINAGILTFVVESGLYQFVDFATRGCNLLDVVLTDDPFIISSVTAGPPFGNSDHLSIKFVLNIESSNNVSDTSTDIQYNWYKADFESMRGYLNTVDWHNMLYYNSSALSFWKSFVDTLWSAVAMFVPLRSTGNVSYHRHKRYPKSVRRLMAKKRRLWRRCRRHPDDWHARQSYRDCSNLCSGSLQNLDNIVESSVVESNNLGTFYRYINKRMNHRNPIAALADSMGSLVVSDSDKANLFNQYFSSVSVVDNGIMPNHISLLDTPVVLDSVIFTNSGVCKAINKLKSNLSSGPDGLPPLLFKQLKHCLAEPLSLVFTQLLSVSEVPKDWKGAIITPVFKKGAAGEVSNYRPISLTCVASKLMERIISSQIFDYLLANNILHPEQHGFFRGRSTCTNLLESLNDWTFSVQYKRSITVVYIDFSKAFDSVVHSKLLHKLASCGISGRLLHWIGNFLSNRTHQTRVGLSLSEVAELTSGIVQGSGIGPLLFVIFIDDLIEHLKKFGVRLKLFADDVKIYAEIVDTCSIDQLQCALDSLHEWSIMWQLPISINKCCILHIGSETLCRPLCINGSVLPIVKTCRDLGVLISNDLSPSVHIDSVVAKAHQRANAILRCFVSRDARLLIRAFTVYVRPILEFNCVTWSPHTKQDIEKVEKVQRRFTKRLRGFVNLSYSERLHKLELCSLELRRLYFDLYMCYRIIFGQVNVCMQDFFEFNCASRTRGHPYKLYKCHSYSSVRASYFANRIINVWNTLPSDRIDFSSFAAFKRTIQQIDLSTFLLCY